MIRGQRTCRPRCFVRWLLTSSHNAYRFFGGIGAGVPVCPPPPIVTPTPMFTKPPEFDPGRDVGAGAGDPLEGGGDARPVGTGSAV